MDWPFDVWVVLDVVVEWSGSGRVFGRGPGGWVRTAKAARRWGAWYVVTRGRLLNIQAKTRHASRDSVMHIRYSTAVREM